MKNEIVIDNIKFWVDQNIIHTSINGKIDKKFLEIEDIFVEVILALTVGNFKPLLIDLTTISKLNAINLFKILSRSSQIKTLVLSKSFLVQSYDLKLLLDLYNFGNETIVPNKISTKYSHAVKYCNQSYEQFNASY
ncbi:hypothetical protein L3X39_04675 [Sabulilitoribacter multivorans]|uniref:STAS domain-containing protein n=1 Tax=Flaviramulus multivorans TaxID=1304750 RepID=A0ABS9IH85_9FLAO|nr:hypothetical protein [Flaviramulus multivorans]MCF7559923.1 hypothetical protein [Flaviramulus multivorans]